MKHFLILLVLVTTAGAMNAHAAEPAVATNGLWPQYGYIGFCALLLVIVAIVLAKTPARKLNE